tara:strand:+ start:2851 stop:5043 length:2193 start_codon:yes stop_codon:yes gene_type:complete
MLAQKVVNFEKTPEDTLTSIRGPAEFHAPPYESVARIATADGFNAYIETPPRSIFHTQLLAGSAPMLLARFGSVLWRFMGGGTDNSFGPWKGLAFDLNDDDRAKFPDQYVVMNDKVIWTNGVNEAKVISYDNMVVPLGFSTAPGAPTAISPAQSTYTEAPRHVPNSLGYSWPGNIGTPGDTLDGRSGALLAGAWYYYTQYESVHGDLSPLSSPSNAAFISTMQADPYDATDERKNAGTELDDLTRAFLVEVSADAPEHTVAIRLYRTPDTRNVGINPQLIQRVAGASGFVYGDNRSDASLGSITEDVIAVPTFKLMCTHQGRLVIANTGGEPGIVRRSQAGFPGTFQKFEYVYPDSGGAEVTGVVSHAGMLLAFTETSVYSLQDFGAPVPISKGIGCVAPSSIQAMPDGTLMWLGRDGFYALGSGGEIVHVSYPIQREMKHYLNPSRLRSATASVDAITGEYRCAIAPAGVNYNTLLWVFDGEYWRRQELGYHIADICQTDDWRQYNLFVGQWFDNSFEQPLADTSNVYVMGREQPDWSIPRRRVAYQSAWIRGDDTALTPLNVRSIFLGMVDSFDGQVSITFYKNGSWEPVNTIDDIRTLGVDAGSNVVTDIAGSAVINTAKTHIPRLFWRQVPVDLRNVNTWAFKLELFQGATTPSKWTSSFDVTKFIETGASGTFALMPTGETPSTGMLREITPHESARLHLAAFAFDMSIATSGSPRGRIPHRKDK